MRRRISRPACGSPYLHYDRKVSAVDCRREGKVELLKSRLFQLDYICRDYYSRAYRHSDTRSRRAADAGQMDLERCGHESARPVVRRDVEWLGDTAGCKWIGYIADHCAP